jgi:hypothetical protein
VLGSTDRAGSCTDLVVADGNGVGRAGHTSVTAPASQLFWASQVRPTEAVPFMTVFGAVGETVYVTR